MISSFFFFFNNDFFLFFFIIVFIFIVIFTTFRLMCPTFFKNFLANLGDYTEPRPLFNPPESLALISLTITGYKC